MQPYGTYLRADAALEVELQLLGVGYGVIDDLPQAGHLGLHLVDGHLDGRQHDLPPPASHHLHPLLDVREGVRCFRTERKKKK